ncbi:MAG: hypothetical protein EOO82_03335, partial [Oxalobacteraceae bacterium]
MTIVRSSRQPAPEKKQCPICLEQYCSTPEDRQKVTAVKMGCLHMFCRECIETHLSSSIACPLPWCKADLPLRPDACKLCAAWQRDHAVAGSLVVTVRAVEMLGSIKDALKRLAQEDDFHKLPDAIMKRILAHVRATLKRYEWQFHTGIDLAELLDPFLPAIDVEATREYYGPKLSAPTPRPAHFPSREHDPDDYPPGQEPWIAAFFRQWALEYEKENGELKEGWDVTNLYTIVPLRAASARVLIEQSIGRGLRLPYGQRTGVTAIDRLNIVAHDRFQEIVDEARKPGSAIRMRQMILTDEDFKADITIVSSPPVLHTRLGLSEHGTIPDAVGTEPLFTGIEQQIAKAAYEAIQELSENVTSVSDIA